LPHSRSLLADLLIVQSIATVTTTRFEGNPHPVLFIKLLDDAALDQTLFKSLPGKTPASATRLL